VKFFASHCTLPLRIFCPAVDSRERVTNYKRALGRDRRGGDFEEKRGQRDDAVGTEQEGVFTVVNMSKKEGARKNVGIQGLQENCQGKSHR